MSHDLHLHVKKNQKIYSKRMVTWNPVNSCVKCESYFMSHVKKDGVAIYTKLNYWYFFPGETEMYQIAAIMLQFFATSNY